MRKIAIEIDQTIDALLDLELEHRIKAQCSPVDAPSAITIAHQAKVLSDTLATIWERSERDLSTLARLDEFAPINDLLLEVIACKRGAKARHKAERAKREAQGFSLEQRVHIKESQGHVQAHA